MNSTARIINGFCSIIGIFMGLLSFMLSGIFMMLFPGMASFAALISFMPFIIILLSIIGLFGSIKNNLKVQVAFDICLLPVWYVGTALGGICLILFYFAHKKTLKHLATDF
ncbi:hypothetical protein [Dryocola sp. BD626]|uniref:hypothetical protein n=1 Tax=Dryocola sp. BD626 TaxID=3133273 RepID=UPI003F5087EC